MRVLSKTFFLFTALAACITFSSCEPEPGSGPNAEGIHGSIKIHNQHGEEQDPSAVTVTIEQTGKTTKTDGDGAYWLPYLPSGSYTLLFTKTGHTTTSITVEHTRTKHTSTLAPTAKMIDPSTYYVTQVAAILNTNDKYNPYFKINGKLNKAVPAGKSIQVKLYLGNTSAVSLTDYVHTFSYNVTTQEFEIIYPYFASLLINNKMKRGDTVYMVLFTDAVVEDTCHGSWEKPMCTGSTTINTSNPILFTGAIPEL